MNKSKKIKNYSRKYSNALKGAPVLDIKELCIKTANGGLKKIDPLDVVYEGSSFGLILDMYHDLQKLHSEHKKAVGHSISALIALLKQKGYNTPNVELNALIGDINELLIIEPNKVYDIFYRNADGYIVSKQPLLQDCEILEVGDIPEDYANGYWKIENGKWLLDKELYNQYWSV
jgi:hypothetical protein